MKSEIYKKIWSDEVMPQDREEGIYLPLHKKEDIYDCVNYRGLCLLNIGYKILANILCRRFQPHYLGIVGDYQAGFMPGRSTTDNIFIVRQVCEKYREYGRTAWHVFVDYRQVFDSIHRPSLWLILRSLNVPENIIRLAKACYNDSWCRVRVGGDLTDVFSMQRGLRQGCPLSCMLSNYTLEWVMRSIPLGARRSPP